MLHNAVPSHCLSVADLLGYDVFWQLHLLCHWPESASFSWANLHVQKTGISYLPTIKVQNYMAPFLIKEAISVVLISGMANHCPSTLS